AMAIPGAAAESGERARVRTREELVDDGGPVRDEVGEDLHGRLAKEVEIEEHLAGEHRIFMEDRVRGLRIAQPLDEGSEAFLRRLSAQKLLQPGHVQFEDESAREKRKQP